MPIEMKLPIRLAAVVFALMLIAGCGKPGAAAVAASHAGLFPSGPLKGDMAIVIANLQTNGYVPAEVTLVKMERENPDARQLLAIHDTMIILKEQIRAAAASGDINASNQFKAFVRTNWILF